MGPQAGAWSYVLSPPLQPFSRKQNLTKQGPVREELDRYRGGASSKLDPAPLRAASQSRAGPGAEPSFRRQTRPRRFPGQKATSQRGRRRGAGPEGVSSRRAPPPGPSSGPRPSWASAARSYKARPFGPRRGRGGALDLGACPRGRASPLTYAPTLQFLGRGVTSQSSAHSRGAGRGEGVRPRPLPCSPPAPRAACRGRCATVA